MLNSNELLILSNHDLQSRLLELRAKEREITVDVLDHLVEVERRLLFAEAGYSSLFSYCTGKLLYSESAANRRIRSARTMKRFSEVRPLLLSGALNLSTLSTVSGDLNEQNVQTLLSQIAGRSQREVESLLCHLHAKPEPVRESIKAVAVKRLPVVKAPELFAPVLAEAGKTTKELRNRQLPEVKPEIEKRFEIRFSLNEQAMRGFERAQVLLSSRCPKGLGVEGTVELLVQEFLKREDPCLRAKRREAREQKPKREQATFNVGTRVNAATRDAVFTRDGGQCSYVSPDGKRCSSTHNLQIDHISPRAVGGSNDESNLRLLCRQHNVLHGVHCFGEAIMRRRRSGVVSG